MINRMNVLNAKHLGVVAGSLTTIEGNETVAIFGHYDVIKEILQEVIRLGYNVGGIIDIEASDEFDEDTYNKEYVLWLTDSCYVSVEKAWYKANDLREAGYYFVDADVVLYHEDVCNEVSKHVDSKTSYWFTYNNENEKL